MQNLHEYNQLDELKKEISRFSSATETRLTIFQSIVGVSMMLQLALSAVSAAALISIALKIWFYP